MNFLPSSSEADAVSLPANRSSSLATQPDVGALRGVMPHRRSCG